MLNFPAAMNHISDGGAAGLSAAAALFGVLCAGIWIALEIVGVPGGPITALVIVSTAIACVAILTLFKPLRWALLSRLLSSWTDSFRGPYPDFLLGIGPGGAIIAGMLSKLIADKSGTEPIVFVIDRNFEWKGPSLEVTLDSTSTSATGLGPHVGNMLVVTPEVHSGNTLAKVVAHLGTLSIPCQTFSVVVSPNACIKVDYSIVESDRTGLIPWNDSPTRRAAGK